MCEGAIIIEVLWEQVELFLAVVNANREEERSEGYIRWLREEGYDVK